MSPPDRRLVGALRRLDALDEGLEEQRGGAAPGALATRLLLIGRKNVVSVSYEQEDGEREGKGERTEEGERRERTLQRSALDE